MSCFWCSWNTVRVEYPLCTTAFPFGQTGSTMCRALKGKAIPSQAWTGQEVVPGGWGFNISRHLAHEGGKVVSPTHRPPLPPQERFLVLISVGGLSQSQGHSVDRRIMSMKNSNDTIRNRTHDLPACSAVPQPTVPLHAETHNKDFNLTSIPTYNFHWLRGSKIYPQRTFGAQNYFFKF